MAGKEIYVLHDLTKRRAWLEENFVRQRGGEIQNPKPWVKEGPLPENEEAFLAGLCLGNFWKKRIVWGNTPYIAVSTESRGSKKGLALKLSLGTWGETRNNKDETKTYLHSPTFDFLVNKSPNAKVFNAKSRYAPFLLGVLVGSLSDKEKRISQEDETLARRIYDKFQEHFGFSLGNIGVENRPNKKISVIKVKDVDKVISALKEVKGVKSLPFLKDLPFATGKS